jgi:tyrosyl-tRNA synthetase
MLYRNVEAKKVDPVKKVDPPAGAVAKKGSSVKKPEPKPTRPWTEPLQQDFDRIFSVGEECISGPELQTLLTAKGRGSESTGFNLYDGFEPSGRMHIAQGVFKAMNVNKCTYEGTNATFVFWVADWFALMNDKMGGDLEKIRTVGHYLIEVWKAAGMDLSNVVFKWASEEITTHADKYWPTMLDVARRFNVTRIKKCCQIMGRLEGSLTAAQILYPLMQCTDVFFLKADICQLGVDQRKVNMLAREYCDAAGIKHKPIILSHHMLYGLKAGQEKMSKSDPDSAVFMEDSAADVERKIMNAYCPIVAEVAAGATDGEPLDAGKESMHLKGDGLKNPCLDYIENIIFSPPGATFSAGSTTFQDYGAVRDAFLSKQISEDELKRGLIIELNRLLEPVRSHFDTNENAKNLLSLVQQYKKESASSITEKVVRRLNLVELKKVPAGAHLVFAPLPSGSPTLQSAMDVLTLLQAAEDRPCVLLLSDWTARVCNSCDADLKAIAAYHSVFVASLKALKPRLMENVQVLLQSDAILADPSNYWISVINVGRHFMLDDIMGPSMKDSEGVGRVIGRLMQVADAAGVEPASIAMADSEDTKIEGNLVTEFFGKKLPSLSAPSVSFQTLPSLRLQPERESDALRNENDEYFLLDDPKISGKSKLKKAFCEPGNVTFCPPIALADMFALKGAKGVLEIHRSPENGGDRIYESVTELEKDFADGSLHPSDLKTAAIVVMGTVMEELAAGLKADGDAIKAGKTLKAFQKKAAKQKK